ncbi:bifunctional [glutamine synthetase] adenylyltransferase/[glutamine synthetase]-adenylyl-L-tyrosine phosphorylase [Gimibacter soli]|uniref:Bifunctional glutamine synthetase adenylyltransferase/adenylyl-removing enzyme n=1 Tax=Gimibacter soli TaxID=3024400 RepID=A0AAE9XMJ1_9PROT|nr:bifunctional [glutamine synthetase] adenylyltransferase/[glutamine synthetase]-adenylyl-L-tyrosine phosphorylase [Gimibacter soli]WCL52777.1 bifunctional [glutamine synthetase] adenylyltransferase/[glutamine synthetase]-adenylyl-L-tyrosine phosphorylase [Gimibacter soli]
MTACHSPYPNPHDTANTDEIWAILCEVAAENGDPLPANRALADAVFGNSPFLATTARRRPATAIRVLAEGPDACLASVFAVLDADRLEGENTASLMAVLRQAKADVALITAFADVSGEWPLLKVTAALSDFASKALDLAVAHLLEIRMRAGELGWPRGEPESVSPRLSAGTGFFVLGMGKLGAGELNYSSDIDLILFYEPEAISYTGRKTLGDCYVRLARDLIEMMEKRTGDGYVFRTDLRLRPDPASNPLAMTVGAAEVYYHSMAVNWERSAMIKAATVAGDRQAGADFLASLSSWIWRRTIDFAALADIAAIKNQINRHYGQQELSFEGYNVKLGQGGIREVEFYTQVHQLLFAGRHPSLILRGTLEALDALVAEELIEPEIRDTLAAAYIFLRTLEHRIQMVNDDQTHEIPTEPDDIARLATFCGFASPAELKDALFDHTRAVKAIYDAFLPQSADDEDARTKPEAIEATLTELGYSDVPSIAAIIDGWRRGRYRALKNDRSKNLMKKLLPRLVDAFAATDAPSAALTRFDQFIEQLPAGVQLFSLLDANPSLFKLLARVMGLAPALAETLAKKPSLWDAVLDPDFFMPVEEEDELAAILKSMLRRAKDYQDILDIARRFVADYRFRIGVHGLEGIAGVEECAHALARVADVTLKALVPAVSEEFARRHGHFPGGSLAVLAMGKYGGGALTQTSDLDIVFLYDVPDMNAQSDGDRPLMPSQYFSRLCQNIITAITALTPEGRLFEVDTRLRPSGNQGPIVVTLKTFSDYYTEAAWTWEHMALTRARVVIASDAFGKAITSTIHGVLTAPRDGIALKAAVADMRLRLAKEFGTVNLYSVKHVRGGLVDIEFIGQYLMLREGARHTGVFIPELMAAFDRLTDCGALDAADAATLKDAYVLQHHLQSIFRLCLGKSPADDAEISAGLRDILTTALGIPCFDDLKASLARTQAAVYALYQSMLGDDRNDTENDQRNAT